MRYFHFKKVSIYESFSIQYQDGINAMVEIVILVITRWHDSSNRMSLRNTLGSKIKANHQNTKLIFVLGVPENATDLQKEQIVEENKKYQDILIPSVEDTYHTLVSN